MHITLPQLIGIVAFVFIVGLVVGLFVGYLVDKDTRRESTC